MVFSQEGGGEGPRGAEVRGREGVCGDWGKGGAKYFFQGRNSHQVMHFIADTDTDKNFLELILGTRYKCSCSLQL